MYKKVEVIVVLKYSVLTYLYLRTYVMKYLKCFTLAENILLEGGPSFEERSLDRGGGLHSIDQAVLLALCVDVENSNPQVCVCVCVG